MKDLRFNALKIKNEIVEWIRDWFDKNGKGCMAVIGLSGGKDSTIVAALCAEALGKERVLGVAMPEFGSSLNGAYEIAHYLGINFTVAHIGNTVNSVVESIIDGGDIKITVDAEQNISPRIRMATLYAISRSVNGRVSCNSNLSEDYVGYCTIWGDDAGDFAPLASLTVSEILLLGDALGLPYEWVHKTPSDGLLHSTSDEAKFGFSYAMLDKYIRHIDRDSIPHEIVNKIEDMHKRNEFKTNAITLPHYKISPFDMLLSD